MLDDLGLDASVPFESTSQYEDHIYLCEGLERKGNQRAVLEPIQPDAYRRWGSDTSSSEEEDLIAPTFHFFDSVGSAFGPDGGNIRLDFKVNKERATWPPVRDMIIVTEEGDEIMRIRPKCKPWRLITRGCVELAISEWMRKQRELPPDQGHPQVHSTIINRDIDGEIRQVAVWLWKGLEQDRSRPNVFKIFF